MDREKDGKEKKITDTYIHIEYLLFNIKKIKQLA